MNAELYHWGIKGMKWYRRRYRNPDGTLTPEGKERYKNSGVPKMRSSTMSDEELRAAVNRMQLEKTYRQLYSELHPDKAKRIKKFVADLAENTARTIFSKAIEKMADKAFKQKDEDKATDLSEKDISKIGDKELAARVKRLNSEKTYRKEYEEFKKTELKEIKEKTEDGKKFIEDYLEDFAV